MKQTTFKEQKQNHLFPAIFCGIAFLLSFAWGTTGDGELSLPFLALLGIPCLTFFVLHFLPPSTITVTQNGLLLCSFIGRSTQIEWNKISEAKLIREHGRKAIMFILHPEQDRNDQPVMVFGKRLLDENIDELGKIISMNLKAEQTGSANPLPPSAPEDC
jgi:hypothetical protein